MVKNRPIIWIIAGPAIGTIAGIVFHNIPAGICLGTAMGILFLLVSFTDVERKSRN